jgi:hypothetical protein
MSDIIRDSGNIIEDPIIDSKGRCYDAQKDITIYSCNLLEDNSSIEGYTEDGTKAKYLFDRHSWFYGHDISKLNFIPLTSRSIEEQKEIRSKGGKTRWEKERNKKTLNDIAKELLDRTMSDEAIDEILGKSKEILGDDNTVSAVMMVKMIQTAMAGSFKAAEFVRDTAGYKPESRSSLDISADIMTDADRSLLEKIDKRLTG